MIKRINITINDDLLNKIDSYSKKIYLSRSGFISLALSYYLDSIQNIPSVFRDKSVNFTTDCPEK